MKKILPRWIQLYNFSKQLNKSREIKSQNRSKNNLELEISECTFHPVTHYTEEYNKKKRTSYEINRSLHERHNTWNNLRTKKIKNIYLNKVDNEFNKFSFCPNVERDQRYFTTINKTADQIVADPESYTQYINQKKKLMEENRKIKKKGELTPGNGKIYKEKPTKVKEFSFETEKKHKSRQLSCSNIASLLKQNSKHKERIMIIPSQKNIHKTINSISFNDFKEQLHNELHKLIL